MSVTGVNLSKEIDNWIEKKSSKNWQSVLLQLHANIHYQKHKTIDLTMLMALD